MSVPDDFVDFTFECDKQLLQTIDAYASSVGQTRDAAIREAVKFYLANIKDTR